MRTLVEPLLQCYSQQRLCGLIRLVNEHAALHDSLFESNVQGRPYVGLGALVLTQTERADLLRLTEGFNTIFTKAMTAIVQESSETLRLLGWPENLEFALRREPLNRSLTPLGRFDFALDTAGVWRLMEFNSDTPSGAQEITLVEKRQWPYLQRVQPGQLARLNPQIAEDMLQALYDEALYAPEPPNGPEVQGPRFAPRIGLLVQGRHLTDLAQVSYYADNLEQLGLECVIGDISNLSIMSGQLYLLGKPVDALYRLFPVEWLSVEPLFAAFLQANLNGWLKAMNNLRGFLAQSKSIMAWVWQHRASGLFSAGEEAIIEKHLPATYLLEHLPADFDYSGYIVKEFYGREGAEVYNGSSLSLEGWQQCRAWRTFVAQQLIDIAPVNHIIAAEDWKSVKVEEVFPCVGGFIMGGKFGGCYTRVGARITDSYAQFIPTLVEK